MQVQLADLLFQGHPGHQVVDVLVHVGLGGAGRHKHGSGEGEGEGDVFQGHISKKIHVQSNFIAMYAQASASARAWWWFMRS